MESLLLFVFFSQAAVTWAIATTEVVATKSPVVVAAMVAAETGLSLDSSGGHW